MAGITRESERMSLLVQDLLLLARLDEGRPLLHEPVRLDADTGPGLSETDAGRVFERFYRADKSRARASGGVGLGLSIVAAVAEAHGGRVAAVARTGAGATFRITIPAVPAADNSRRTPRIFSAAGASMVPTTTKGGV